MAPKKKAPEPPPPPAEVKTGPPPVLVDGIQVPGSWLKQLKTLEADTSQRQIKERAADLHSDPKMRAVRSVFAQPTSDLSRNASLPSLGLRERERMRVQEAQEKHLRRLSDEAMGRRLNAPKQMPQHIPEETRRLFEKKNEETDLDPMRASIGRKAPSLLANVELAHGDMLKNRSPLLRCTTLDRVHGWYEKHLPKEWSSMQQGTAPAYLKFDKDDATMSGSLRAEPNERRFAPLPWDQMPSQKPAWLVNGMRKASSEAYLG
jgi:hypothetical protein